jgi:hypothetical protein
MDEEYCLNRAEIFHGGIVATYCYYVGIHFLITGIYFAKAYKDDERRLHCRID